MRTSLQKDRPKFGSPLLDVFKVFSDGCGTEMLQDARNARDVENPAVAKEASQAAS